MATGGHGRGGLSKLKSQNMQEKAAINDIADMNERVLERGRIAPAQTIVFTAAGGLTTSKRR